MSDKPQWVTDLENEPCTCKSCDFCNGTGNAYFDMGGKYIGAHRTDDLSDCDPCDECRGGIAEECERCTQLNGYDMETLA